MIEQNIKLVLSYDGTDFHGFKSQPGKRTVESELLKAIFKISGEKPKLICAGRTDAGVHAEGQVVNFFSNKKSLTELNWLNALNTYLPWDIRILKCEFCSSKFNARRSAIYREYRYQIVNSPVISALISRYASHYRLPLDIELLKEYTKYLIGEHDFSSFSASSDESKSKFRFIHSIEIKKINNLIIFRIIGNAFLHKMVRNIIGTIIELHKNKAEPIEMKRILDAKNRNLAGPTYEAKGLIFYKVYYPEDGEPDIFS